MVSADEVATRSVRGAGTIFADFSAVFFSRVAGLFLSLAIVVITTRILGPAQYATYAYVTILALAVFTVGSAWTSSAVPRYGRAALEAREPMTAVTWERIVITAPAVAVVVAAIAALGAAGALPSSFGRGLVLITLAYGVVLVISDHIVYVLQAAGRMIASSVGVVLRQAVVVVALLVMLVVGVRGSVLAVAVVTVVGWAALTLAFTPLVWRLALWPPRLDPRLRRRMLAFSAPMIAFTLSQYVIQTVDLPLIGLFRSAREVGLYALAYLAYTALQQVAAAPVPILTPLFVSLQAAGKTPLIRRFADRAVPQIGLLVASSFGVVLPLVPFLVPVVFGERYRHAAVPLAILLLATGLLVVANLLAPIMLLYEESRAVGIVNLLAAAINIVLDVTLLGVFHFGIWAPAAATAASVAVITIGYLRTVRRCTHAQSSNLPIALLPLAVGLAATLALDGLARPLVGCTLALVTTITILVWGDLFREDDADFLLQLPLPRRLQRAALAGLSFVGKP